VEARDGDDATVHTFGVGVYATSLDAQPEVWGFIARGKGLDEVGLVVEEKGPEGEACRRPADRRELEESLGRDKVFDKGRYRTALAQFLYRDRDAYQRVMELITAAKSYRELVARARNLDDLFIGLLPPPAETEFREVGCAMIDGIQADLDDWSRAGFLRIILERLTMPGGKRKRSSMSTLGRSFQAEGYKDHSGTVALNGRVVHRGRRGAACRPNPGIGRRIR
jgi:hypothetical protein